MYRIRKISFLNHPVLKNLSLDFCDQNGDSVDTIIFAGENGTGKSTIINALYTLVSQTAEFEAEVEYEKDNERRTLSYRYKVYPDSKRFLTVNDGAGLDAIIGSDAAKNKYPTSGIYSDVDINFHSKELSSVTSLNLDEETNSRKSSTNLPTQINQLLIDIQALDDADVAFAAKTHPDAKVCDLKVPERIPRFTSAFNRMFDDLTYSRVGSSRGHKHILFQKNGVDIPIDSLSSGEKQIVYRGCFLLKDAEAMNGAFVFIDEPEISLHPNWQSKILDYYKSIFTNEEGTQTSQLFVVTHSPFIIHNENRRRDKVIVLSRNRSGDIEIIDKPEYYKCTSMEVVQDAFSIPISLLDRPIVYLEGRTDEKYFNKALEVYNYNVPFQFKWIGHMDNNNQEVNTGKDSLGKALQFLIGQNLSVKTVCLFDCDTKHDEIHINNAYARTIPTYKNSKDIIAGIENALVLDSVDITRFYTAKIKPTNYGCKNISYDFRKMDLCNYLCELDTEQLQEILIHLKEIIDELDKLFRGA